MTIKEFILAVDTGTSVTKAVLYDINLNQVHIARRHYQVYSQHSSWSEQDPDTLYRFVLEAMREAMHGIPVGGRLAGIVFSSQMYSVLAVTSDGQPLTRSMTWADTRAAEHARRLAEMPDVEQVIASTGCPLNALYPMSKIAWIKENVSLPVNVRFISIKEYIIYRLTGRFISDWSVASSSGLMDIRRHAWDAQAMDMVEIEPENLSQLAHPGYLLNEWNADIADDLGIPPGTPIILGGGDGPLASLGMGAFTPEVVTVNVGTSAAARCIMHQPVTDPSGRLWTYAIDDQMWVMGGMTSSGTIINEWVLKQLFGDVLMKEGPFPHLIDRAAVEKMVVQIPACAEGLLFTPYMSGEQCPDWQPYARGSFYGLNLIHTRAHMARAVLEGITFSIYRIIETVQQVLGNTFQEVRITGGLGTSPLWTQMAADIFGIQLVVPGLVEGSARGAAMLGWTALDRVGSLQDFELSLRTTERVFPHPDIHDRYMKHYQDFLNAVFCARSTGLVRPPTI